MDGKLLRCAKNWTHTPSASGSYVSQASRLLDEKLVVLEIFKIRSLDYRHVFRLFESIFSLGKVVPIHLWPG